MATLKVVNESLRLIVNVSNYNGGNRITDYKGNSYQDTYLHFTVKVKGCELLNMAQFNVPYQTVVGKKFQSRLKKLIDSYFNRETEDYKIKALKSANESILYQMERYRK